MMAKAKYLEFHMAWCGTTKRAAKTIKSFLEIALVYGYKTAVMRKELEILPSYQAACQQSETKC